MLIYCTVCWQANPANSKKCSRCGADLEKSAISYRAKLVKALSHPEPETVQRAAWILGELKAAEAVEPLLALINRSEEPGALEGAVEALGKIGDRRAVPALSRLIRSSYLSVRLKAVDALQQIGGRAALAALRTAMGDPKSSVSQRAANALKSVGKGQAAAGNSPGQVAL